MSATRVAYDQYVYASFNYLARRLTVYIYLILFYDINTNNIYYKY